ncbi:MAG: helix-turn-helix transcriptional regulator [Planctomycetes bacterium]|nr:helix-turn-helix transcriptional regulator [Planctomycetota bacterium]
MLTKAQHARQYRVLPPFLREMREKAGLTQRELGALLRKPQSWIYNCETGNRRVDVTEFIAWCEACKVKPGVGLARIIKLMRP